MIMAEVDNLTMKGAHLVIVVMVTVIMVGFLV